MAFVSTTTMLEKAQDEHWAVGAFNAENMEMIQAIISAAEELRSPVIIQTTPGTISYGSVELYCASVAALAMKSTVPVAIHLDHGNSLALAAQALRAGYTSIMIDGSSRSLAENIALTASVVAICKPNNIPVEGELGKVGGKEDDTVVEEAGYTDPDEAIEFVKKTGVSSLAVGVGTAHGVYAKTPALNVELITTLRKMIDVPMVLHGASGLSDSAVRDCIDRGICKVNFATELRIAYTGATKKYLDNNPVTIDPKKFGRVARDAVRLKVMERMVVCGSVNKAEDM